MKNIALGQYYPVASILQRMDPRMKVILAILYIVASFLCRNVLSFAALLVSAILLVALSRIPLRTVLGAIRPLIFVMLFTAVVNVLWTGGDRLLVSFWRIHIYVEGLYNAAFIMIRILVLILGASMFLTYTTTPIMLTDALERLLTPLRWIGLPVHDFAMMMTIALRFIPTLVEETDKIMAAQKARGADFSSGSPIARAKALIPILVPLFVSAFRRADELAMAMECRCYRGGEGRTRLKILHYRPTDFVALGVMVLFGAALLLLNRLGVGYTM